MIPRNSPTSDSPPGINLANLPICRYNCRWADTKFKNITRWLGTSLRSRCCGRDRAQAVKFSEGMREDACTREGRYIRLCTACISDKYVAEVTFFDRVDFSIWRTASFDPTPTGWGPHPHPHPPSPTWTLFGWCPPLIGI